MILITLSVLAGIGATFVFRSRLAHRLMAAFLFVSAIVFIAMPQLTNMLAHAVGVGRGADLLLYLAIFAGIHAFLLLYLRTRVLERKLADQVRALALRDSQDLTRGATAKGERETQERQHAMAR